MKKVLLTLSLVAFTASVFAQGTVQFVLNGTGFRAPVYGPETGNNTISKKGNTTAGLPAGTQVYTGPLLSTPTARAQLFGGPAGTPEGNLVASLPVSTFRTGSAAGLLAASVVATIPGVALDAPAAVVQVRAWDGPAADWAAADPLWRAGTIAAGMSDPVNVANIGGTLNTPPIPTALQSFNIYFVPEPSSFALAGLGAAAMLIFRRRK